jgi:L-asparaginase / beta-aspartyl-peptidase
VAALVEHAGLTLAEACARVVRDIDGEAGLVAVDATGAIAMPFNTRVMHRAHRCGDEPVATAVWSVAH